MKWFGLVVLLCAIPVLAAVLRGVPKSRAWIWMGLGLLPFVIEKVNLDVAPVSWPYWPGYVKGIEFTPIDSIAIAVLLAHGFGPRWPRFTFAWILYVAAAAASIASAGQPTASVFSAWQALRVMVVFLAVARVSAEPAGVKAILRGMMIGILLNAGFSVAQHLRGVYQATGLFGHQNTLGMMTHFIAFPAAAMVLARRDSFALLAAAGSVGVAILTASRATIGLQGAGYLVLAMLAVAQRRTPRNFAFMVGALASVAILAPLALSVLAPRFVQAEKSHYDERAAFAKTAWLMIEDRPFGVGANQYVIVANTQGYSNRAGVVWSTGSRGTNVHNTYLLTAAEQGFVALAPLLLLLLGPPSAALLAAFRFRRSPQGAALLGCAVAGFAVAVHCGFEWIFVRYPVQVAFAANIGLISGLLYQCQAGARQRQGAMRAAAAAKPAEQRSSAAELSSSSLASPSLPSPTLPG
jgi:O-antigen ligase